MRRVLRCALSSARDEVATCQRRRSSMAPAGNGINRPTGSTNAFQRWAYTPSFRLWWPILKPMYGRKFRRFMEERLSLADEDYPPTTATVTNQGKNLPSGVAQIYWKRMHEQDAEHGKGKT